MSTDQDFPVLVAQNGPLTGERWPLDRPLVIGRESGIPNDLIEGSYGSVKACAFVVGMAGGREISLPQKQKKLTFSSIFPS